MKRSLLMLTLFAWSLLTLSLTSESAKAQIDPLFAAWRGFASGPNNAQVAGSSNVWLQIWGVNGNSFTGGLSLYGRGRVISGRFSTDGTIDISEVNSTAPIKLHGSAKGTRGGSYIGMFFVTQGGRNLGSVEILRLFPTTLANPLDPTFPPGPCYSGRFSSDNSSLIGLLNVCFDPSVRNTSDAHNPPSNFTGKLVLGDRSFNFVSSINDRAALNAYYKFELIGLSTGGVIPCIRVTGELVPAVRPGEVARFQGTYELINLDGRVVDAGSFDIASP